MLATEKEAMRKADLDYQTRFVRSSADVEAEYRDPYKDGARYMSRKRIDSMSLELSRTMGSSSIELDGLTPLQDSVDSGSSIFAAKDVRLNQDHKVSASEAMQLRFDYAPTFGDDGFKKATVHHDQFDLASFTESKSIAMGKGKEGLQEIAAGNTRCQTADTVPEAHNRASSGMTPNNLCGGLMISEYLQARERVVVLEKLAMEDAAEIARLKLEVENSKKGPSQPMSLSSNEIAGLRQFCQDTVYSLMSQFFRRPGTRNTRQSASDVSSNDL